VAGREHYVVISTYPEAATRYKVRRAMHIGRVKTFAELDALMNRWLVQTCLISPQPEPHLVSEWMRETHYGGVLRVVYTADGMRKPEWDYGSRTVTVDRTYALNVAYEEIKECRWWIPGNSR